MRSHLFDGERVGDMLTVAGAGTGSIEQLTVGVYEQLKSADRVLAFGRIGESFSTIRSDILKINKVEEVLRYLPSEEEELLLLASGDPCFFGIIELLKRNRVKIDRICPGISSMQYLASRLGLSWHDATFLSFHGRELISDFCSKKYFILTDRINNANVISDYFYQGGCRGKIFAGYGLSYSDERIIEKRIGEQVAVLDKPCVVVILNENIEG